MKKRTKRKLTAVLAIILLVVGIIVIKNILDNNNSKSEYEIAIEKELKTVNKLADKAWSKAYSNGKKEDEDILAFVKSYLTAEKIDVNRYYFTLNTKGVEVALKHQGLISEPGYYKAGTNFTEYIKDWQQLINTRGINVVEGRLGALRKLEEEIKVDIVIDDSITEIKDKVVETDLNVNTLVIPNSVVSVSNIAFEGANIAEIVLDTNITELDGHFKGIETLEKITFNGNIKVIRGKTFNKTNIKEVNFIGTVEDLVSIKYLTYFDVPSHDKQCKLYINGLLVNEINIPEGVKEIKDFTLHNYTNITKITLPASIEYIGTSAFTGTSVNEVQYDGTKEMWNEIKKTEEWYFGGIECIVYCSDGEIEYKKGEME